MKLIIAGGRDYVFTDADIDELDKVHYFNLINEKKFDHGVEQWALRFACVLLGIGVTIFAGAV